MDPVVGQMNQVHALTLYFLILILSCLVFSQVFRLVCIFHLPNVCYMTRQLSLLDLMAYLMSLNYEANPHTCPVTGF
jgi:uncharacterized protein YebE (UPF0316 family)